MSVPAGVIIGWGDTRIPEGYRPAPELLGWPNRCAMGVPCFVHTRFRSICAAAPVRMRGRMFRMPRRRNA